MGYRINFRTNVFFDFRETSRNFQWSSDYHSSQGLFGVTRQLTPLYRLELAFGAQKKFFDKQIKGVAGDVTRVLGTTKLVRKTPKSQAELSYNHFPADFGNGNSYYFVDLAALDYSCQPFPKTRIGVSAFFENFTYEQEKGLTESGKWEKRDDSLYGGNCFIEYAFQRWCIFPIGYTRIQRESNLKHSDYNENRVFLSIKGVGSFWGN
ncbi:MAG: hypothetical protein OS130_05455 [Thermodesulfobacteriota bacterium]|nr:MAG: hypothetical protein OS130_05455 [Thermodesulfobacteriota bacterium]